MFKEEDEDGLAFAYPAGAPEDVKNALEALMEYSESKGYPFTLYNVTEEHFAQLNEWYPDEFQIEYNRDAADYVYESEKLATLSGKKLHSKRNHINKFKIVNENWNYETLTDENVEECFQMALRWRNDNGCDVMKKKRRDVCDLKFAQAFLKSWEKRAEFESKRRNRRIYPWGAGIRRYVCCSY